MQREHELTPTEDDTSTRCGGMSLMLPQVGSIVGDRYRITRLVGAGGMGTVFEAESVSVGRRCALKFLHSARASRSHASRRFEREARLLARLEHDHLTSVLDYGRFQDATPYYVMEYLEGDTLRQVLQRDGTLAVPRALELMRQTCRGMAYAHGKGVVHRDLKPDNLMLIERSDGQHWIKILDFGVARWTEDVEAPLTPTGAELGTAHYMSPEQARGAKDIDARSDVYSLGAILYEMLSGQRVHPGASYNEVLFHLLTRPHQRLSAVVPSCWRAVDELVERCLCKEPAERFRNAGELMAALSELQGAVSAASELPAGAVSPSSSRRGALLRSRFQASIVGFVVGAMLVGAVAFGAFDTARRAARRAGPIADACENGADPSLPPRAAVSSHESLQTATQPPALDPVTIALALEPAGPGPSHLAGSDRDQAHPAEQTTPQAKHLPSAPAARATQRAAPAKSVAGSSSRSVPEAEGEFPFLTINPYQGE